MYEFDLIYRIAKENMGAFEITKIFVALILACTLWYLYAKRKYFSNDALGFHSHYYFIGATEGARNKIVDALIVKRGRKMPEIVHITQKFKNYRE